MTPELETAAYTFAAVAVVGLLKGAARWITSYVKGTPTQIDDKIWAAVQKGFKDAKPK